MSSNPLENVPNPAGQPFGGNPEEPGAVSSEWDQLTSGASAAPTPTVSSGPPKYAAPPAWLPQPEHIDNGYTVQTSGLTNVADVIKSQVPILDKAIGDLRSAWNSGALHGVVGGGFEADWFAGQRFDLMLDMIAKGFIPAATQIAGLLTDAARRLADTASTYAEAENRNHKAALGGQGGSIPNDGHNYAPRPVVQKVDIKPGYLGVPSWAESKQQIMSILHNLEPGPCTECGSLLLALGGALNRVAQQVADSGNQLAEHWQGRAAAASIQAFQTMHDQAATLAAEAIQVGNVLIWVGKDVFPVFKAIPSPVVATGLTEGIQRLVTFDFDSVAADGASGDPAGNAKADQAASQYLKALENYLDQAYNAIPSPIAGTPGS
ncbi:MAG: hypothetical protein J2P25_12485 [Nocardiopsaceae bacterium]|nr:hypothetical protein [Nocardiopsaceae bacterium]